MDRFEFSIAMHLIRAVLAGATLPPTLPISLKVSRRVFFFFELVSGLVLNRLKVSKTKMSYYIIHSHFLILFSDSFFTASNGNDPIISSSDCPSANG